MHNVKSVLIIIIATTCFFISEGYSIPIDWHGTLGFNTTNIINYGKSTQTANTSSAGSAGSQEVVKSNGGDGDNASFQSYIFKLEPEIVINDASTVYAEFTNGYAKGGRLGDNSISSIDSSIGNALYAYNNTNTANGTLAVNKLFLKLYSDAGTYLVGRHSVNWALGAVISDGKKTWDHYSYIRDGVTIDFKLGNFFISPYWAKLGSKGSMTRSHKVEEHGVSLLYDNPEKDFGFGFLYSKKDSGTQQQHITTTINGTTEYSVGVVDTKLFDLYFKKTFGDIKIQLEVPIFFGKIGQLYNTNQSVNYKARSFILETDYKVNDSWNVGIDAGLISGEDGKTSSFDASFLNPNYQIALLMFRYNLNGVTDDTKSIYDSYITNATYVKVYADYLSGKWLWNSAFIFATAGETAKTGEKAYNHSLNKQFTAIEDQADDLGFELDFGFDYKWNKEISITGNMGYHFVGDYYAFTNTGTSNDTENSYIFQFATSIDF